MNPATDTPTTHAPGGLLPVSVVIPTYNRAHLIARSIKSALANVLLSLQMGVWIIDASSGDW